MAKNSVRDFDATAANNTDIQSVDIAENCAPSGINNAIRELMADVKDVSTGTIALESPQADSMTVTGDLTVDTNTLFVDASADKVAMGTTSADADASVLSIKGTDPAQIYDGQIIIHGSATSGAADTGAGIGFKGHHGTGNRNLGAIQSLKENSTSGNADAYMRFVTRSNSGGLAEAMRIDSSGDLLVGKTTTAIGTAGSRFMSNGQIQATASGQEPFFANRLSSDGLLFDFRKDGTTVGSISNVSTNFKINGVGALLFDHNGSTALFVQGGGLFPWTDNTKDLGTGSLRFDDIFATNGTINTSDQNEKQQIASLTAAEITAAKAISKLFKTFKWNDKVEAKGDNARTHAGVIAQEVQQAMTDAGLDAADYAFWCSDTWWETQTDVPAVAAVAAQDAVLDDDGNIVTEAVEAVEAQDAYTRTDTYNTADEAPEGATERTRLGIRYPELLAFVGAATEQRLADIETRLTALEA
ncbi:tail fiber domain-containing protein [Crocinitomicaceae bacterium]|nr:tail fiber domain-containing protein [Crocinitomicaceae bacterium]